jgi:hypothetical protein
VSSTQPTLINACQRSPTAEKWEKNNQKNQQKKTYAVVVSNTEKMQHGTFYIPPHEATSHLLKMNKGVAHAYP